MKRFRVKNESNFTVFRSNSLLKCVDYVRTHEPGLNVCYIDDVVDDIEVEADEVLKAYDEREYYLDLQAF
jgi:hypothetical protein